MKTPHSARTPAHKSAAFTLIELLVVVAIIAVLAGLTMSVTKGVMDTARKVSAKNDLVAIVTAVKAYYTDYGHYPLQTSVTTDAGAVFGSPGGGATNDDLMNVLRFATADPAVTDPLTIDPNSLNVRQTRYLEVAFAKNSKSGIVPTGTLKGQWVDPWGVPYVVFIDGDYNSDIDVSTCFNGPTTIFPVPTKVQIAVGAACIGYRKNGQTAVSPNLPAAFNQSVDLISWR